MPAPAPIISNRAISMTRGLHRRFGRAGARSTTAGRPPRCSCGGGLSSTSGSRFCVFCSDIRMLFDAARGPIPSSDDLDEIGVAKPLAVVEKRNDFWRDPEQHCPLQLSRRVRRDLGKLLKHQLPYLVDLLRISDGVRLATDRQTPDLIPAGVG